MGWMDRVRSISPTSSSPPSEVPVKASDLPQSLARVRTLATMPDLHVLPPTRMQLTPLDAAQEGTQLKTCSQLRGLITT